MRKGFVVSAVLYPLLVIALALIMGIIAMSDNRRKILDNMKLEVSEESDIDPEMSNTALYYKIASLEETIAEMQARLSEERLEELKSEAKLEAFPVGSIFISTTNKNPGSYIGGTWQAYGQGRTLVGVGSNGTTNYIEGKIGGNETFNNSHNHTLSGHTHIINSHTHTTAAHTLTVAEMPNHNHATFASDDYNWYGNDWGGWYYTANSSKQYKNSVTVTGNKGGGQAHSHGDTGGSGTLTTNISAPQTTSTNGSTEQSLLQPYITVYFWKRTA